MPERPQNTDAIANRKLIMNVAARESLRMTCNPELQQPVLPFRRGETVHPVWSHTVELEFDVSAGRIAEVLMRGQCQNHPLHAGRQIHDTCHFRLPFTDFGRRLNGRYRFDAECVGDRARLTQKAVPPGFFFIAERVPKRPPVVNLAFDHPRLAGAARCAAALMRQANSLCERAVENDVVAPDSEGRSAVDLRHVTCLH
ncbi:hypothetical protein X947_5853 [Burkholderia pseudomallei MSHR7334]|nr:hypothetical protein X947_5853 [Burkholderia pseudomallei MSHR7334]